MVQKIHSQGVIWGALFSSPSGHFFKKNQLSVLSIYILVLVVGERSPDLERWFEYNKLIKSQIVRVEKDPEITERILKVCNIFATNTYCRVGFRTSRFNHSCQPNALLIMESGQNQIRAIKDIKEGMYHS